MAAENMKNLNTRIRLKYDTLERWIANDPVLLAGEVAIATVANNETNANSTKFQNLPNVVMKVGDGTKKFSELNYFSAMAADVYAWAKKTEAEANESFRAYMEGNTDHATWLKSFISGEVKDTNTNYKLEQDTNNAHILRLYSQDIGQTEWTLVNEITTADTVYDDTALAGRVTALETKVDTGDKTVTAYIADAIAALDLDNKYDAKGAAAQALTDAKAYADGKDAAIKAAKDAADAADAKAVAAQGKIDDLEKKVGEVPTDKTVVGMIGENTTAIADEAKRAGEAEAALAAKIGEVAEGENLAGKLAAEVERATKAEEAAAGAAAAAQKTADDLADYVGEIPADAGVDTVVGYVEKLTADITSGTEFTELEGRVKAIEDDYLVEADKTELAGLVTAEKERAEGIEGGLRTDVDKANEAINVLNGGADVEGSVDKKIADAFTAANLDQYATDDDLAGVAGQVATLIGDDSNKSVRTIANEELAKQLIAEGAQESLDTLAEIAAWIQEHPGDAAAMNKAIEDLEALVGTLPEGATATTVVGYVDEVVAALKIGDYAKAADLLALTDRVAAMEAKVANWDAAEQNAKDYADGLNTAMNTRMEAVEDKAHEHANKDLLDTYTQTETDLADAVAKKHEHANAAELAKFVDGDKAKLDDAAEKTHEHKNLELLETYTQTEADLADAVAKKHEHENAEVLGGITAEKVAAWDAAEGNAKGYADELNTAMDERVTKNTNDIAGLHAIAKSGNVNDLAQTEGEYIVFCCGTSDTII